MISFLYVYERHAAPPFLFRATLGIRSASVASESYCYDDHRGCCRSGRRESDLERTPRERLLASQPSSTALFRFARKEETEKEEEGFAACLLSVVPFLPHFLTFRSP